MFTTGFSEIVLIVHDLPRSARFYKEVVGLEPRAEADDSWAWFWTGTRDDSPFLALHKGTLLFENMSPLPQGERWGQVHYAFTVPREKLDLAVEHVSRHDVEVYGPTHFDWMDATSYYFYDPDGNLLEFWSPDQATYLTNEKLL